MISGSTLDYFAPIGKSDLIGTGSTNWYAYDRSTEVTAQLNISCDSTVVPTRAPAPNDPNADAGPPRDAASEGTCEDLGPDTCEAIDVDNAAHVTTCYAIVGTG